MKTGGPAFPQSGVVSHDDRIFESSEMGGSGLTIRDFFAAKAMQSLAELQEGHHIVSGDQQAYEWADAMLKAREGE